MQLIPSMDLTHGRCVRLLHGDFSKETHYRIAPPALYARYAALGATWCHVVDLDGARVGTPAHLELIHTLKGLGALKLQVGGGLRDATAVHNTLKVGVDRVVIGSLAISAPDTVTEWLTTLGPERVVLALDVRLDAEAHPRIATHGWQQQTPHSLWDIVAFFSAVGLRHVLCTDVGRDGALSGPNETLYRDAVHRFPHIAWQASGGIRDGRDLAALAGTGVSAAISGRALIENRLTATELAPFLPVA